MFLGQMHVATLDKKPRSRCRFEGADWGWLALILLLGVGLRGYQFASVPAPGWSKDEYAFAWHGMSLLQRGVPESWTILTSYPDRTVVEWNGDRYIMASPWFDHPPGFSLLVGASAMAAGAGTLFEVDMTGIRAPMLPLAAATLILMYVLSLAWFGRQAAIAAGLCYAINPSAVLLTRQAFSENLLVPMLLTVLLLYWMHLSCLDGRSRRALFLLAAVTASLASWVKAPGVYVAGTLVSLCLLERQWFKALMAAAMAVSVLLLQLVYASFYDLALFLQITSEHAARFRAFTLLELLVAHAPGIRDHFWLYAWLLILPAAHLARRQWPWLVIPLVCYVMTAFAVGMQGAWHPWYVIPLLPMLCMAVGIALPQMVRQPGILHPMIAALVLGLWSFHLLSLPGVLFAVPSLSVLRWAAVGLMGVLLISLLLTGHARRGSFAWRVRYSICCALLFSYAAACVLAVLRLDQILARAPGQPI